MNKQTLFAIAAGVVILFVMITAIVMTYRPTVHHEETNQLRPKPAPYMTTTPRSHPTVVTLDSLAMGEKLKHKLNHHPKIIKIHHNSRDKSHYFNHEITVHFQTLPSPREIKQMERMIDGKLVDHFDHFFIFRSSTKAYDELCQYFQSIPSVAYCEPNYIYLQNEIPNDLLYSRYQWNLPVIDTEEGWTLSRGKKSVTIAVIDSGVDLNHPDLVHRLQTGYNVLAENNIPEDDNGHGTHVAGIIASEPNNHEGVAGITWFNRVMPIKALNADGYGTSFDVAKGIRWAVDHGAKVINLSLGNYQPSTVLEEAIRYAYSHDVVLVAASGNDSTSQPSFPAAYPEVISVGAVNPDLSFATYSNYGNYLDVVAPGTNIASTFSQHRYAALSGTSMAAPHVTALAGLIRSINPHLTNDDVKQIIINTATDLGNNGKDPYYGYGLINVYRALELASRWR
jgi:type VII secretion-associated serine protease mycosin